MGLAPLDYLLGPCSALALGLLISLGLGDSVTVEPPAPRVKINFLILIKTVFQWKLQKCGVRVSIHQRDCRCHVAQAASRCGAAPPIVCRGGLRLWSLLSVSEGGRVRCKWKSRELTGTRRLLGLQSLMSKSVSAQEGVLSYIRCPQNHSSKLILCF